MFSRLKKNKLNGEEAAGDGKTKPATPAKPAKPATPTKTATPAGAKKTTKRKAADNPPKSPKTPSKRGRKAKVEEAAVPDEDEAVEDPATGESRDEIEGAGSTSGGDEAALKKEDGSEGAGEDSTEVEKVESPDDD